MGRQFDDVMNGVKYSRNPLPNPVTSEVIGSIETDVDRIVLRRSSKRWASNFEYWLRDTLGNPMGYIKVMVHDTGEFALCDIEVRPEYRGHKLSHRLIRAVEKIQGQELIHTGGYTPEGLAAIAGLFHDKEYIEGERKRTFNSMTFVDDWDKMWAKYPI